MAQYLWAIQQPDQMVIPEKVRQAQAYRETNMMEWMSKVVGKGRDRALQAHAQVFQRLCAFLED
jgi:hypothetical protein